MAIVRWLGRQKAIKQVDTYTITVYDATTTYKATLNGKVVSVIAAGRQVRMLKP